MDFEIVSEFSNVETIARGKEIRELTRLKKSYGSGNWSKKKGIARILLKDAIMPKEAEVYWYECHGIGKKEYKIKRFVQKKTHQTRSMGDLHR